MCDVTQVREEQNLRESKDWLMSKVFCNGRKRVPGGGWELGTGWGQCASGGCHGERGGRAKTRLGKWGLVRVRVRVQMDERARAGFLWVEWSLTWWYWCQKVCGLLRWLCKVRCGKNESVCRLRWRVDVKLQGEREEEENDEAALRRLSSFDLRLDSTRAEEKRLGTELGPPPGSRSASTKGHTEPQVKACRIGEEPADYGAWICCYNWFVIPRYSTSGSPLPTQVQ